jgi:hypothetical protein
LFIRVEFAILGIEEILLIVVESLTGIICLRLPCYC